MTTGYGTPGMEIGGGRVPSEPGSHPSGHAASGVDGASRVDPSRITELRELLEQASWLPWDGGCLVDGEDGCQCAYIFDGAHAGGIGQVFFPQERDGLTIHEHTPEKAQARANLRLIIAAVNALPALLEIAARDGDEGRTSPSSVPTPNTAFPGDEYIFDQGMIAGIEWAAALFGEALSDDYCESCKGPWKYDPGREDFLNPFADARAGCASIERQARERTAQAIEARRAAAAKTDAVHESAVPKGCAQTSEVNND